VAYVEIAFPQAPHFGHSFSYAAPAELYLQPGDAVLAPFGPRELPGIVVALTEQPVFAGDVRVVRERIGDEPLLAPHQIALARWIAEHYLAPLGGVVAMMLPRGLRTPGDLQPPARPATVLRLQVDAAEAVRRLAQGKPADAGRALRCVAALLDAGGTLPIETLKRGFGLTTAVLALLTTSGVAAPAGLVQRPHTAEDLLGMTGPDGAAFTPEQRAAIDAIDGAMRVRFAGGRAHGAFLLHGVTGSGKTEVYISAARLARARGRSAIVLVPEVALTPQTIARFERIFPGGIALLHGRLPPAKRRALWHAARAGDLSVVIGPRSALFAPLSSPGLIVLDEEHDPSFKQSDPAPRYHAREVASELARLTGAVLVLGSATPDVESTLRVSSGRYRLLSLPRRVAAGGAPAGPLPKFEVVDMSAELRSGNAHVFSRSLDSALQTTLAAGEQALIFLNRRGSAPLVLCRDCGYAPRCPRCSVAYALHGDRGRLVCHHCFHSRRVPSTCPKCRSARFRPMGMGTQRLEEVVRERFPDARVVRWDGDTADSPARHEEIAQSIARREVDIVVGTQVVAKGHDFGGLTLVGVVSADLSLNIPDFRAAERTFQLLVQVGGRAGRRGGAGRVVVQTYTPEHYAVRAAAAGDYEAFYEREIAFRRDLAYPPCAPLTRLVLRHSNEQMAEQEAHRYAEALREERRRLGLSGAEVVGPAPCYFSRIAGRWRWHILLRGPAARELLAAAPPPRAWIVDVEPVDVL
jgi:primosomal protein N' (replication factor Y)